MLRNVVQLPRSTLDVSSRSFTCHVAAHYAKNDSLQRQGKIMTKLFGNRIAGSKKRWYPTVETNTVNAHAAIFKASQFGKSSTNLGGGKSTLRRMTVLNKLFMQHITDLMATSEAAEAILGRGLQIQRVKISSDFSMVNVYWLGTGNTADDAKLESELQRCSGLLRHELSQLRLMGEVPRIKFVRDKRLANLTEIDSLLRNMDFGPAEEEEADVDVESQRQIESLNMAKRAFFGEPINDATTTETITDATDAKEKEKHSLELLPPMRHDVLGLDHQVMMHKILTKMRKSKQAWDVHNEQQQQQQQQVDNATAVMENSNDESAAPTGNALQRMQQKLDQNAAENAKFEQFLAKRRDRKNTPERKKYNRIDQLSDLPGIAEELDADAALSEQQRRLLYQEDFLHEDQDGKPKS